MLIETVEIAAAFAAADAFGGIYHVLTDKGFGTPSQVRLFQRHHLDPLELGFDWRPLIPAVPVAILGFLFHSAFLTALAIFVAITQVSHYYAHHHEEAPQWWRWLQRCGVALSPEHHAGHHRGDHNANFCILNGMNDCWMNRLTKGR